MDFSIIWPEASQDVAEMAEAYLAALSPARRRWLLWDISPRDRDMMLGLVLRDRALCAFAFSRGRPAGLAWIMPLDPRSLSGIIHFSLTDAGAPLARELALAFLDGARRRGIASLMCMIPWPNRSARAFCLSLGFSLAARLSQACHLHCLGRNVDAAIFCMNFAGNF